MDSRDDIKSRLPIDQLVAQYCQLKKKGRSFVALCPFHNDSRPSLLVSPDKGIAYCFACQSGGDVFSFFQKIEGVDFPTALKLLAEKTGVTLPRRTHRSEPIEKDEKKRVLECLDAAVSFYRDALQKTSAAFEYLRTRGLTDAFIEQFQIGFAPDSFSQTYDHLLKAGFSRSEILAAGLGVQRELAEERIYDRFRNRIMFPITDAQGQVIGFGGRTLADSDAKYINSPDGPLYHKSAVLFGLAQAKEGMRLGKRVVLVEGYFDVIALHRAGVPNVVAVSGTALTEEHARILKRYVPSVVLCLDQDRAGRAAANKAFQLLSASGLSVQAVSIPAKDPDELVQRDPELLKSILAAEAKPYLDHVLEQLAEYKGLSEPRGKAVVAQALFPLLDALKASVELRSYLQKAATMLGSVESEMNQDFLSWRERSPVPARRRSGGRPGHPPERQSRAGPGGHQKAVASSADVDGMPYSKFQLTLGIALVYPEQRLLLRELIPPEDKQWQRIVNVVATDGSDSLSIPDIVARAEIEPILAEQLNVLAVYCEENFGQWSQTLAAKELKRLCMGANRDAITLKQTELIEQIREARKAGRADDEVRLLTQYQKMLKLQRMAS